MSLSWADITVAVPTVDSRAQLLCALSEVIQLECRDAAVVIHRHPATGDARADFPVLMDAALGTARPWLLQLEDDVALAPNFGTLALRALNEAADRAAAISLFSRSKADLTMLASGQRWRRQAPSSFCMMQAIFLRADALRGLSEWAPTWYARHPEHRGRAADLLLGAWLSRNRQGLLVHVPSLVQHRQVPSSIPGHHGARQSESYRNAFGEV